MKKIDNAHGQCPKCKRILSILYDFYKSNKKSGVHTYCRECDKARITICQRNIRDKKLGVDDRAMRENKARRALENLRDKRAIEDEQ